MDELLNLDKTRIYLISLFEISLFLPVKERYTLSTEISKDGFDIILDDLSFEILLDCFGRISDSINWIDRILILILLIELIKYLGTKGFIMERTVHIGTVPFFHSL